MSDPIERPDGSLTGGVSLEFSTDFSSRWGGHFHGAQVFVDSEVLRRSEPYIPLRTGTLIRSGIIGTVLGSGLVKWLVPYASKNYYSPRPPGTSTGPLRGPFWFERMKAVDGDDIVRGAGLFMRGETDG